MPTTPSTSLPPLEDYLEASQQNLSACLSPFDGTVDVNVAGIDVTLHYVKFNQHTKKPKFKEFAKALAKHVVRFTLSSRTRNQVRSGDDYFEDEGELQTIARDYFRKVENSGEVGELLLFFLLEAALKAPQAVCKMELKTNPNDEIKGADGIHVKWDEKGGHLDVFLGEAKMYQNIGDAMDDALDSVANLYNENKLEDELHLVTSHFKHLDQKLQNAVTAWVRGESSPDDCHIIHACLIGWDFGKYRLLDSDPGSLFRDFEDHYRNYCKNISRLLNRRFDAYEHRHLSFNFLFIPFRSVKSFRKAFYRALLGKSLP
ncbi:MAG: DUF1837 domain-containing protein [Planctomycetota bacterium]